MVPLWGMQVPPPQAWLKALTARLVGPVRVLFAGVVQSTWNLKYARLFAVLERPTSKFGSPAGGCVPPSSEPGSTVCSPLVYPMKHCCVALAPETIAARL